MNSPTSKDPALEDDKQGDTSPFTCDEAFRLIYGSRKPMDIIGLLGLEQNMPFYKAVRQGAMDYLFAKTKIPCIVVQKRISNGHEKRHLLFDSHLYVYGKGKKFHGIVLAQDGSLENYVHSYGKLPEDDDSWRWTWYVPKHYARHGTMDTVLGSINSAMATTPIRLQKVRTIKDMESYLSYHKLNDSTQIYYATSMVPQVRFQNIHQPPTYSGIKHRLCVYLCNGQLHFTTYDSVIKSNATRGRNKKTLDREEARKKAFVASIPGTHEERHKTNRSSGMTLLLKGTALAHHLGLISKTSWSDLVTALNKTVLFMWPHFDAQGNLRSVSVLNPYNGQNHFSVFNVETAHQPTTASDKQQYKSLFGFLTQQQDILESARASLLDQLVAIVNKREADDGDGNDNNGNDDIDVNLYRRCSQDLKIIIQCQRIIFFQDGDLFIHKFRLPLSQYVQMIRQVKTGTTGGPIAVLQIVNDAFNYPISLRSKYVQLINFRSFLIPSGPLPGGPYDDTLDLESLLRDRQLEMPPLPMLDETQTWKEAVKDPLYFPGKIAVWFKPRVYVRGRGGYLAGLLAEVHETWTTWMASQFGVDAMSSANMTFSQLSHHCVMKMFARFGGSLVQSPEKLKPHYDYFLRKFCHGGFAFTCQQELSCGEALFPHLDPSILADNAMEYDLVSSYGSAAAQPTGSAPGGFCMAFFNPNSSTSSDTISPDQHHSTLATSTDHYRRWDSFEFTTTYAIIHHYSQTMKRKIRTAFHNYSPYGLYKIGPYFLDLVLVLEGDSYDATKETETILCQLDGQYTHGCATCPPLASYVGGKSLEALLTTTKLRDDYIQLNVERLKKRTGNDHTYHVYQQCHDPGFGRRQVQEYFKKFDRLAQLQSPYQKLPRTTITIDDLLYACPDDLTYLLVCHGQVDTGSTGNDRARLLTQVLGGSLFCCGGGGSDTTSSHYVENATCKKVVLNKRWLEYLVHVLGFKVTHLEAVFFFRACTVLPKVYWHLVSMRETYKKNGSSFQEQIVKRMVNYSCGYFGLNLNKATEHATDEHFTVIRKSKTTILSKLPQNIDIRKHKYSPLGFFMDQEYFVRVSIPPRPLKWKWPTTYLPFFIQVIEEGKLRLHQRLLTLFSICKPMTVKLLYVNVDNLVLATASKTLSDLIEPGQEDNFVNVLTPLLAGQEPGQMKLEWTMADEDTWTFISPRLCTYVIQGTSKSVAKFSGITADSTSSSRLFQLCQNILGQEKDAIVQTRRVHKPTSLETAQITLNM